MVLRAAAVAFAVACGGSTEPIEVEALPATFLFVQEAGGSAQIHRWFTGSISTVTSGPGDNVEPSSAADRLVFTSYRDGNAEIYLANLDGTDQHRIVTSPSSDNQPDLSPDATRVVFMSSRSGAQRLYVADSSGASLAPLETGSATNIPETAPTWSPDGLRIAFASSRTGTSQIFVVPATGGTATQVTYEAVGAFEPAWSTNGDTLFFVTSIGSTQLRATRLSSGAAITFPPASGGYAQPACGAFGCLAVRNPYGDAAEIVVLQRNGSRITTIETGDGLPRDPALVRGQPAGTLPEPLNSATSRLAPTAIRRGAC